MKISTNFRRASSALVVAVAASLLPSMAAAPARAQSGAGTTAASTATTDATAKGTPAVLEVGRFSAEREGSAAPTGWKPLTFRNIDAHTRYTLVRDATGVVLRADSQASASGLVREQAVDLKAFPIIEWRWRADNVLSKADVKTQAGDDYPVRLYITFAHDANSISLADRAARLIYGVLPPRAAINYIWDTRAPVGTTVPNAYTDRVRMIVVESGAARTGQWISYRRNLAEDFRRAFGYEAPLVSGIAVMTDTDNTGESATAYFGDIRFTRAPDAR